MAIQVRRGPAAKFDSQKLLPGEWAVKLDTKEVYICYAVGDTRRMATYEEMKENIDSATKDVQTDFAAEMIRATKDANAAVKAANSAISGANEATSAANTAANTANEKAQAAETATTAATTAAANAQEQADKCDQATTNGNIMARLAAQAAVNADAAAQRANEAAAQMTGGAKILWSGLLKGDSTGHLVDFTIPESCFFNDGRELILVINGYCPLEERNAYELFVTGLCFGTPEDFGLTAESEGPYKYGEDTRYAYRKEASAVSGTSNHYLKAIVRVQKVTDSRYALCTLTNTSTCFYITSVSAVIAG